jgi:hypothetical protein
MQSPSCRFALLSTLSLLVFPLVAGAMNVPFSAAHPQYAAALSLALAQEADQAGIVGNNDDNFEPEDFGLERVGMLPTNPLYIFKAARRAFTDAGANTPAEKVEN